MKIRNILITSVLALGLFIGGCSEGEQSTGNKQLDDALGIKTEEKAKEPKKDKKEEEKKTEKEKSESKIKITEKKKETKTEKEQSTNEDVAETAKKRNFVISTCYLCEGLIHEDDNFKEYNGHYLCKKCYNKGYTKCMDCGKIINGYDNGVTAGSDGVRCKECTKAYENSIGNDYNNMEHCNKCGKELDIDSPSSCTYDDNGNLLCLDCYFAENDQVGDAPE